MVRNVAVNIIKKIKISINHNENGML